MKFPVHLGRFAVLASMALFIADTAQADGLRMNKANRLQNPGHELVISPRQQAQIEFIDRCHRNQQHTPYLFRLQPAQTAALRARTGIEVRRLVVHDARHGSPEAEFTVNAALRIAEDRIEVSLDELYDEAGLRGYEHEVMGWQRNPLAEALAAAASGELACPDPQSR